MTTVFVASVTFHGGLDKQIRRNATAKTPSDWSLADIDTTFLVEQNSIMAICVPFQIDDPTRSNATLECYHDAHGP